MSDTTTAPEATPEATKATTEEPTGNQQGDPADKPLGENGEKALKAEREARKVADQAVLDLQKRLDAMESEKLTDLERAQKAAKDAQELAQQATADALRFRIAAKHGIPEEDAELFLTGTDEQTLERQAARLVERTPKSPLPDPSQGGTGTTQALNGDGLEQALRSKLGIV